MNKSRARKRAADDQVPYPVAKQAVAAERRAKAPAVPPCSVVGLVTTGLDEERRGLAENLGAVWALEGERVLIVERVARMSVHLPSRRRRRERPVVLEPQSGWSERCAVPGTGLLATLTLRDDQGVDQQGENPVEAVIAVHRPDFDRIITFQDLSWFQGCPAPACVAVVEQCFIPLGYEQTVHQDGRSTVREHRYSPAEAAALLREQVKLELGQAASLAQLPLVGLLHRAHGRPQQGVTPEFKAAVFEVMASRGTPILAGVPYLRPEIMEEEPRGFRYPLAVIEAPDSAEAAGVRAAARAVREALDRRVPVVMR
ncbi:hypothetical protein CTZ27_29895 [Streptomyces griseocarneus]|nr:hypothetical protein CTZ27_29895 [Streptomyces griseocarneus]